MVTLLLLDGCLAVHELLDDVLGEGLPHALRQEPVVTIHMNRLRHDQNLLDLLPSQHLPDERRDEQGLPSVSLGRYSHGEGGSDALSKGTHVHGFLRTFLFLRTLRALRAFRYLRAFTVLNNFFVMRLLRLLLRLGFPGTFRHLYVEAKTWSVVPA